MKRIGSILFIVLLTAVFFWQFFVKGLLPIPADTVIGLYHPFIDLYAKDYPNGIPFKNFLITDPVRQQFPWRKLVISAEKNFELPLWNPYNFSGTPLLANFQSATFYPLNFLFFVLPFQSAWSILIFLAPLMSGLFLYLYLRNLKLDKLPSVLGSIVFAFCGFSIAWLEWGNILHTALWLPLILLATDKLVLGIKYQLLSIRSKKLLGWAAIYMFSLISSFFAGHLQIFFYLGVFSFIYFIARWLQYGRSMKILGLFLISCFLFLVVTAVQWIPTLQLINLSARNVDVLDYNSIGWFVPWQHLVQFVVPDYFGNPTTLNYWGTWNYGELVGYVGIIPLILAIFAMFYRKDKKTLFFGTVLFLSLVFSFPTFFGKIPYLLKIPFFSTAQPTRLLFIIDFALAVLSALGFDYLLKSKRRIFIIYPLIFVSIILICLWIFIPKEHLLVVRSNLLLPTALLISALFLFILLIIVQKRNKLVMAIGTIMLVVTIFDLFRFGWKFTPFTNINYLFPQTRAIDFLQEQKGIFRIMTMDSRILPPNFSSIYKLQSIDGYDPLYLLSYGELIAASGRRNADINSPFGFNRIITPQNYEGRIIDLLGVKYVLSLTDLKSVNLEKVFQEGETRIYKNNAAFDRAFFIKDSIVAKDKRDSINALFDLNYSLKNMAVINAEDNKLARSNWSGGSAEITSYRENNIEIKTENNGDGFLVLMDSYYPTWHAKVDGKETKIYKTDYNFRGVLVPAGNHVVKFYNSLF